MQDAARRTNDALWGISMDFHLKILTIQVQSDKKVLERIILVQVPKDIYPMLYETFIYLFSKSGMKNISISKDVDFEKLYNERKKN